MKKINWSKLSFSLIKRIASIGIFIIFIEVILLYSSTKFVYKDLVKTIEEVSIYSKVLQISKYEEIQNIPEKDYYKLVEYDYNNEKFPSLTLLEIKKKSDEIYIDLFNRDKVNIILISKIDLSYLGKTLIDNNITDDLIQSGGIMDLLKRDGENAQIAICLTNIIEEYNKNEINDISLPEDVVTEFKNYINKFYISQMIMITIGLFILYYRHFKNIFKMDTNNVLILMSILLVIIIAIFRILNISTDTFSYSDFVYRTLNLEGNDLNEVIMKVYVPTLYLVFYELTAFFILILTAFEFIKANLPKNINEENEAIDFVKQLMLHVCDK